MPLLGAMVGNILKPEKFRVQNLTDQHLICIWQSRQPRPDNLWSIQIHIGSNPVIPCDFDQKAKPTKVILIFHEGIVWHWIKPVYVVSWFRFPSPHGCCSWVTIIINRGTEHNQQIKTTTADKNSLLLVCNPPLLWKMWHSCELSKGRQQQQLQHAVN